MKKYKVWIEIEEIDESKDIYRNIAEPHEAGIFAKRADAQKFVDEGLLMAKVFAVRLKHLTDIGIKFMASLPKTECKLELQNRQAFQKMLVEAGKVPSAVVNGLCPKCRAGSDKRELIRREFLGNEAIHLHYRCTGCGTRIIEEFTGSDVFIDSGN